MENLKPAGVELRAVIQAVVSVLQCVKIFPDKKIAEGFWLVKMKPLFPNGQSPDAVSVTDGTFYSLFTPSPSS